MDPQSLGNHPQLKPPIVLAGTAKEGGAGPPIGLIDIGVSEAAYLFRVALPGIRKNECKFTTFNGCTFGIYQLLRTIY